MTERTTNRSRKHPEIVLFHSALGLNAGVREWAEKLRQAGQVVHTPDLYEGRTFGDLESADAGMDQIGGFQGLIDRTHASVVGLPTDVIYAGFSNGGGSAELLALTRPGALGVVLMHALLPIEVLGAATWPSGVPVQVHYSTHDPFRDEAAIEALATAVKDAGSNFQLFDYPVSGHLFADPSQPSFDSRSANLMLGRMLEFSHQVCSDRRLGT